MFPTIVEPGLATVGTPKMLLGDAGELEPGIHGVYQLGNLFQLSATEVGIALNIRYSGIRAVDLEIGSDVAVFDDWQHIDRARIAPLTRYSHGPHPKTGRAMMFARYPSIIGFVPSGARRTDGSPHPHAGTGFGINQVIGFPVDRLKQDVFAGMGEDEQYYGMELRQYAYQEGKFLETACDSLTIGDWLPGWLIGGSSMASAIPDGDDLLLALSGGRGRITGCGIARFRRGTQGWRIVHFQPVVDDPEHFYTISGTVANYVEPSLARAGNGSLWMTMREVGSQPFAPGPLDAERLRVFHSNDGGHNWRTVIDQPHFHPLTPISVNRAADGAVYIAANGLGDGQHNSKNEVVGSILLRETLNVYEINSEQETLGSAHTILSGPRDFPPPPYGSYWRIDHPIGLTVRQRDGHWHHLLACRVLEHLECDDDRFMTPYTGCYLTELMPGGAELPVWNF